MAKKVKNPRVKPNKNQIEQRITQDFKRKFIYILPGKNKKEIVINARPMEFRGLFHDSPLMTVSPEGKFAVDGTLGDLKYYYIPNGEYESLLKLFNDFEIPETSHFILTVLFLSMVFASCKAAHENNFNKEMEQKDKELCKALDFLEEFEKGILILDKITLETKEILIPASRGVHAKLAPKKITKFHYNLANQLIRYALMNYKQAENFNIYKDMSEGYKKYGRDMFMGHKNSEKQSQSYYSKVIFDYLRQNLYRSAFQFWGQFHEYNAEVKRLKAIYPRKHLFLFIGKLMVLSKLLPVKESKLDEDIIESIEKKLRPYIKQEEEKIKRIEERNKNSTDGSYEAIPFQICF